MSKKMLINATHLEENRVAIVEDGILSELDIEIAGKEQTRGNIYKGTVVRVESGLQAAFIDYGGERMGFLQLGEIHPNLFKSAEKNNDGKGRPRITDVLKRGQELLLQVVKEERGTKGAALTTFLSLPGRYMVLMPDSDTKGVSRKIEEESQRRNLKEAMASLNLPPHLGYIVRTAGIGQTTEELKRDFDYLVRLYQNIQKLGEESKAPALIYKESNLVIRSIRDYFSSDMDEVLVDDPKVFQEAKDFFQQVMPEYAGLVKLHQERRPIFARYQIEEQIETISKNKVPLPSGGSIVLDQTEALVAVDVNSGKMATEQGVEATAYKTNMEAAAEVGRQLRLRDLGGLIVIDFIDMRDRKHNRDVEKALKDALKNDKARVTVGRISQFGLMEMSRQRIKATLAEGAYLTCPHCFGSGKIKSPEAQAVAFLRKVQAGVAKGGIGQIEGEVPLDVAIYLLNSKREELHEMERQRNLSIFIKGHPDFVAGQAELTFHKREKERMEPEYVRASSAIEAPETELGAVSETVAAASQALPVSDTPHVHAAEVSDITALPTADIAAEGEVKKKRRRRRRKKKGEPEAVSAAESAETGVDVSAAEPQAAAEPIEEPVSNRSQEVGDRSEEVGETAAAPPEEGRSKPKRRRSRRKKPAAAEPLPGAEAPANQEAVAAEPPMASEHHPLPASESAPDTGPELPSTTESVEKKPARRRSRKKPVTEPKDAPAVAGIPDGTESQGTEMPQGEKTAQETATAAPAPEAPPETKPRRSRPRKKPASVVEPVKTAAAINTSSPEAEKHVGEEPAPAKEDEPSTPPRKPARPRKKAQTGEPKDASEKGDAEESRPAARKRAAKPKAKAKESEGDAVQVSAETEASSAAPPPEKTTEEKPKTTRSRKKNQGTGESTEASPQPDAPEEKTAAEQKPKKRAPRKKAPTAKEVESGETTEKA